jgi:Tfp pilus assembly protein PilF
VGPWSGCWRVYWPLVYFDNQLLTVGLEVFLDVLMLLVLLIGVQRGKLWLFLLASVVWGLSALTRPNVLVLAPGLLIWIWIGRRLGARPLRAVPAGLVLLAGAAVVILPVTLRNRIIGGEWVLIATNGGVNFYIGNNPQADGEAAIVPGTRRDWQGGYQDTHRIPELELGRRLTEVQVSDYWYRQALAWIGAEPGAWLHLTFHKLRLFWSPLEVPNNQPIWFFARLSPASGLYWIGFPVVACLGLAGLCLLGREWRRWLLLVLFLVLYMATVVAFFCPGRYRLPVVPVLILLAANGLARLPQLWRTRALARLGTYGGVGCLAALFIATNPPPRAAFEQANEGMAHFNLGLHYAQQATHDPSELPQACAHLEEAVRLRPYHAMARLWLGLCLLDLSRIDEADAQFAAALQAGGDEPAVHTFYGATLRSRGWLAEAAEQYRIALDLQPAEVEAYVELGEVLLELKRPDEAAGAFRGALQRDPDNPAARKGLREAQAGERSP